MNNLSLKGIPTPEIMENVDKMKKIIIEEIYHPWRWIRFETRKKQYIQSLSQLFALTPLKDTSESSLEMGSMAFDCGLGYYSLLLTQFILGYDMAYRLRIQDILTSAITNNLYSNPHSEIRRLWNLYKERECIIPTYMVPKSKKIYNLLWLALWYPPFKRKFKAMVKNTDWNRLQFTREDLEWIKVRKDYDFNHIL